MDALTMTGEMIDTNDEMIDYKHCVDTYQVG